MAVGSRAWSSATDERALGLRRCCDAEERGREDQRPVSSYNQRCQSGGSSRLMSCWESAFTRARSRSWKGQKTFLGRAYFHPADGRESSLGSRDSPPDASTVRSRGMWESEDADAPQRNTTCWRLLGRVLHSAVCLSAVLHWAELIRPPTLLSFIYSRITSRRAATCVQQISHSAWTRLEWRHVLVWRTGDKGALQAWAETSRGVSQLRSWQPFAARGTWSNHTRLANTHILPIWAKMLGRRASFNIQIWSPISAEAGPNASRWLSSTSAVDAPGI